MTEPDTVTNLYYYLFLVQVWVIYSQFKFMYTGQDVFVCLIIYLMQ